MLVHDSRKQIREKQATGKACLRAIEETLVTDQDILDGLRTGQP